MFSRNKAKSFFKTGSKPTESTYSELWDSLLFLNGDNDMSYLFDNTQEDTSLGATTKVIIQNSDGYTRKVTMGLLMALASSGNAGKIPSLDFDPGIPTSVITYAVDPLLPVTNGVQTYTNFKDEDGESIEVTEDQNGTMYWNVGGFWDFVPMVLPSNILRSDNLNMSGTAAGYDKFKDALEVISDLSDYIEKTDVVVNTGFYSPAGNFTDSANYNNVILTDMSKTYKVSLTADSTGMVGLLYKSAGGAVLGYELRGTASPYTIALDYSPVVPVGTTQIIVVWRSSLTHSIKVNSLVAAARKTDLVKYDDNITQTEALTEVLTGFDVLDVATQNGFFDNTGALVASTSYKYVILTDLTKNYKVSLTANSASMYGLLYKNAAGTLLGRELQGIATVPYNTVVDYPPAPPAGATQIIVVGVVSSTYPFTIKASGLITPVKASDLTKYDSNVTQTNTLTDLLKDYVSLSITRIAGWVSNAGAISAGGTAYGYYSFTYTSGDKYRITSSLNNAVMSVVVYKSAAGAVLGSQFPSAATTTAYTDQDLTIPDGTATVFINSMNSQPFSLKKYQAAAPAKPSDIATLTAQLAATSQFSNSYWKAKTIWAGGTSITETDYLAYVAAMLGCTIINKGLGSSMARKGHTYTGQNLTTDPIGLKDVVAVSAYRSLSQNLTEKQWIIDNWATVRTLVNGYLPETLDAATQADILAASYEKRLVPYLNSDLFIWDHGYNDRYPSFEDAATWASIPTDSRDRNTYIGAINFMCDIIRANNPRARICFIGHYTTQPENPAKDSIYLAQQALADYWQAPLLKLWEKTGWSQQVISTTGYWTGTAPTGAWVDSGGTATDMTQAEIWLQDKLHPHSTPAKLLLANIVAPWLNDIR